MHLNFYFEKEKYVKMTTAQLTAAQDKMTSTWVILEFQRVTLSWKNRQFINIPWIYFYTRCMSMNWLNPNFPTTSPERLWNFDVEQKVPSFLYEIDGIYFKKFELVNTLLQGIRNCYYKTRWKYFFTCRCFQRPKIF